MKDFDPKTGNAIYENRFPIKSLDFTIPTLEEEIRLIQGLNKSTGENIGIYPEIKKPFWHKSEGEDISRIVINIISKYGYITKETMHIFNYLILMRLKRIREELNYQGKLVVLIGENDWSESPMDYE